MTRRDPQALRPRSLCVHGGYRASAREPAVVAPIVRSSTFLMDDAGYAARAAGRSGDVATYSRETNPSLEVVEARLAALDGAESGLVFSSGMAALSSLFMGLTDTGDHVLASHCLYGGTGALFGRLLPRVGVTFDSVDITDLDAVRRGLRPETRIVFCESLSNPNLALADIPALAELARAAGALLVVDATFATPIAQRPLELGADVVLHSASKYLGGHSDLIAGVVTGTAQALDEVHWWRTRNGGCMDPGAAYLLDRGLRTLALRVAAQSAGASRLATYLEAHPKVERVLHPSLASHPQFADVERLLDEPGGMLSFIVKGGDEAGMACLRRLKLILEAPSLGGVETIASVPSHMSHVHISAEDRAAMGIPPGLVRLSVGIEDPDDLIADLEQAL